MSNPTPTRQPGWSRWPYVGASKLPMSPLDGYTVAGQRRHHGVLVRVVAVAGLGERGRVNELARRNVPASSSIGGCRSTHCCLVGVAGQGPEVERLVAVDAGDLVAVPHDVALGDRASGRRWCRYESRPAIRVGDQHRDRAVPDDRHDGYVGGSSTGAMLVPRSSAIAALSPR